MEIPSPSELERLRYQRRLEAVDRDAQLLRALANEVAAEAKDNPQLYYLVSTHMTAQMYLDQRFTMPSGTEMRVAPTPDMALQAFTTYTKLLQMIEIELAIERAKTPGPTAEPSYRKLVGSREELAFHAPLIYGFAHGSRHLALPSPASLDFTGGPKATDIQLFIPELSPAPAVQIQVKRNLGATVAGRRSAASYSPEIVVMELADALGYREAADTIALLTTIGGRPDPTVLSADEHDLMVGVAESILTYTDEWADQYEEAIGHKRSA